MDPLRRIFAPGCALVLYKPELAALLHRLLIDHLGPFDPDEWHKELDAYIDAH